MNLLQDNDGSGLQAFKENYLSDKYKTDSVKILGLDSSTKGQNNYCRLNLADGVGAIDALPTINIAIEMMTKIDVRTIDELIQQLEDEQNKPKAIHNTYITKESDLLSDIADIVKLVNERSHDTRTFKRGFEKTIEILNCFRKWYQFDNGSIVIKLLVA